jgi:3-deoxy-D-manno-octulosonate 8-phosphate phosphatase (KDO 8-P phosphatase)
MLWEKFEAISTFIFDVDGVFTDGNVLVNDEGGMLRVMNTRDGQAVRYAIDAGYKVIVITKGTSPGVRKRFEFLGLIDIYDNLKEKQEAFDHVVEKYSINMDQILYMGDDIPDAALMQQVGLPCAPADAAVEILSIAKYISPLKGGQGCVRDVIEKVMRLHHKWPTVN